MHERPADLLGSAFEAVFAPWRSGGALVCILYSGGVDSGVIAWELRDRPETRLFTVGPVRLGGPEHGGSHRSLDRSSVERSHGPAQRPTRGRGRGLSGNGPALPDGPERAARSRDRHPICPSW